MFNSISIKELKDLGYNANLIDVRNVEKYNDRHIPNSKNIPMEELLIRPEKYLDKNQVYYIYCQRGIQSRKVCHILTVEGYNVVNIIGGYEAWILNG